MESVAGKTFGIGEAGRRAGISPDLIRYYERVGVLQPAPRTSGGFRSYSEDAIVRLVFVRNAIRFGFTSKELAGFLRARESGRPPCAVVRAAGQRLLNEMDAQLPRWRRRLPRGTHGSRARQPERRRSC
jgi:DNA-binding transcriptional MerR regulator